MKKLSLILILAAVILGVYGCDGGNRVEPIRLSSADKLETAFEDYQFINNVYYNDFDQYHYAIVSKSYNGIYDVFRSDDDGSSWTKVNTFDKYMFTPEKIPNNWNPRLVYSKDSVYCILNMILYYVDFEEKKFKKIDAKKLSTNSRYFFYETRLLSDSEGGLYTSDLKYSADQGKTWSDISYPWEEDQDVFGLSLKKNTIYLNVETSPYIFTDYMSTDKGKTWIGSGKEYDMSANENSFYFKIPDSGKELPEIFEVQNAEPTRRVLMGITYNNNIIADYTSLYVRKYTDYEGMSFNIFTTSDLGKTWNYEFGADAKSGYFTPAGFLYFQISGGGIMRNKTPLK